MTTRPALRTSLLALLALAATHSASAQYKVVEPDGRVTYTDRPPSPSSSAKVTPVSRSGTVSTVTTAAAASLAGDSSLPIELRQAMARFPVTLYTMADCESCEQARRLLRERGVPHAEKTVDEYGTDALVRLTGARGVPTLSVGAQLLRGYGESDWQTTLDLAGYPRESRLPSTYAHAAATPLVARPAAPAAAPPAPERRPAPAPAPVEQEPPAGVPSIRF